MCLLRRQAVLWHGSPPMAGHDSVPSSLQYDGRFTVPLPWFSGVDEHHAWASALPVFPRIMVPALIGFAQHDSLVPFHGFRGSELTALPQVRLVALPSGGHASSVTCRRVTTAWHEDQDLRWA
jgi:predicted alpha/beta-fold hydrolase